MSLLQKFFGTKNSKTATVAKERLQIILAHESSNKPNFLPALQKEILEVISKYVKISPDQLTINMGSEGTLEVLEVKIEIQED